MISTGGKLTVLESVDSTNNYAMARVRTGLAKHGDGFFAMSQEKGRGQHGKSWLTEPGTNIILTLVMRPGGLQLQQQFRLSSAIALAAYDFFEKYAGDETSIKWPNDIYWRDRKAGGILIENIISGSAHPATAAGKTQAWQWAVIGLGININQTVFPEHLGRAVSLKQITGRHYPVLELAKALCGNIQQRYSQLQSGMELLQEYNEKLYKKGLPVKFKKGNRVFEATVKAVNQQGELIVQAGLEEQYQLGQLEWLPG